MSILDFSIELVDEYLKRLSLEDLMSLRRTNQTYLNHCDAYIEHQFRKAGVRQAKNKGTESYWVYMNLKLIGDAFFQSGYASFFWASIAPLKFVENEIDAFCERNRVVQRFVPQFMNDFLNRTIDKQTHYILVMILTVMRLLKENTRVNIAKPLFDGGGLLTLSFSLDGVRLFQQAKCSRHALRASKNFQNDSDINNFIMQIGCANLLAVLSNLYIASHLGAAYESSWRNHEWFLIKYSPEKNFAKTSFEIKINGAPCVTNFLMEWLKSDGSNFVWNSEWPTQFLWCTIETKSCYYNHRPNDESDSMSIDLHPTVRVEDESEFSSDEDDY